MDRYEKAIFIESSLRNLLETEDKFTDDLLNNLTQTIEDALQQFCNYEGEVKEQIESIKREFLHTNLCLDDLEDEATSSLRDSLNKLTTLVNKEN